MRHVRLFSPKTIAPHGEIELGAFEANYVSRVLRLKPGNMLIVFDGNGGEYEAEFLSANRNSLRLAVGQHHFTERESGLELILAQGISRGDRMDIAVQKSTELGVARITPILTSRSTVRLDSAQEKKRQARWQSIAVNACQQCGRNRVPDIETPQEFSAWIGGLDEHGVKLILRPGAVAPLARANTTDRKITLLIGPEGGFDAREIATAQVAGFEAVSLGPRILRTETAAIAALSILQATLGDFT